jgi:hypothetical protein
MKIIVAALFGLIVIGLGAVLCSLPIWLLWNAILPELFGFKAITWLQALGLSWLSALLFKSSASSKSE